MPKIPVSITLHGANIVKDVALTTYQAAAQNIAWALLAEADDEALRPNRDSVSRAIEETLRDAAETALRVGGLIEEEAGNG